MSTTLSAPNTSSLYSKASLATRTQSLHSLEETAPLPPVPVYEEPPAPRPVYRTKSYSQLETDAVSVCYSEYRPPLSAMISLTEDQQRLERTISRATLIDQDTGNVYQVITIIDRPEQKLIDNLRLRDSFS